MKKSRFTETQIIAVLKQVAAGQECERVRPAGGGGSFNATTRTFSGTPADRSARSWCYALPHPTCAARQASAGR